MELALCVATMEPAPIFPTNVATFTMHSRTGITPDRVRFWRNTGENNLGVVRSYQKLYEQCPEPFLAYIHDDVLCHEGGWDERVLKEFEDPDVGVVGFGGATSHGDVNIYKTPYRLNQLARFDYASNTDDAETHGARF